MSVSVALPPFFSGADNFNDVQQLDRMLSAPWQMIAITCMRMARNKVPFNDRSDIEPAARMSVLMRVPQLSAVNNRMRLSRISAFGAMARTALSDYPYRRPHAAITTLLASSARQLPVAVSRQGGTRTQFSRSGAHLQREQEPRHFSYSAAGASELRDHDPRFGSTPGPVH